MVLPKDFRWRQAGSELGRGGQAAILPVEDAQGVLEGKWALKSLTSNASEKAYKRFYQEIEVIRSLDHPSVIRIVDYSKPDANFHYYVMEFHEGAKSLRKLIQSGNNPYYGSALTTLDLFKRLVEVIDVTSRRDVVHRDLSPANVLVLQNQSIKVIDFGLCQIEGGHAVTLADEGVGTMYYMAPECEAGAEREIDFRSDLYSAGKIAWSAITNQFAFSREALVFAGKSMQSMFAADPSTWHLHHIFEGTIRELPSNRFASSLDALRTCEKLEYVIKCGYPPLELLATRCPLCGFGEIQSHRNESIVKHPFRNSVEEVGIEPVQCDYCGFWLSVDNAKFTDTLGKRRQLESRR